jgi:hypothetical protein
MKMTREEFKTNAEIRETDYGLYFENRGLSKGASYHYGQAFKGTHDKDRRLEYYVDLYYPFYCRNKGTYSAIVNWFDDC